MQFSPARSNEQWGSGFWDVWLAVLEMDSGWGAMFWWHTTCWGALTPATLPRCLWRTHPVRLEGSKRVLSHHKYSLVISSHFPGRHTGPTRQELSDCLKSWDLSLIKDHCLYRMSLMFFWQEWDIVSISCLLSMRSDVAVRFSNTAQGVQQCALLQRTPYVQYDERKKVLLQTVPVKI